MVAGKQDGAYANIKEINIFTNNSWKFECAGESWVRYGGHVMRDEEPIVS